MRRERRATPPTTPRTAPWQRALVSLVSLLLLTSLFLPIESRGAEPGSDPPIRAGVARRDITPREPVPMWGYGARHDSLSQGTLDPLFADALVLEVGGTKLALVGLDLGRSPSEASLQRIRQRIKAEAGIEHSFLAGSHTHHGPVLELTNEAGKGQGRFDAALRYYQEMEEGITQAILEADRRRVPARLAAGSIELADFNRNRHSKLDPKPSDRQLGLLRVDRASGERLALVINFAAHPTMLPASTLQFSADYVGALKAEVEKSFGGQAIFFNGAAGDQSVQAGESRRGHLAFGQALAARAVTLAAQLNPATTPQPTTLSLREDRFGFSSRTDLRNPVVRALYERAFFPELIPNFIDEYTEGIRPRLSVALFHGGDGAPFALVGGSGEFFSAHAIRLRERARLGQLFFFGYCNGYHQYFPTIEGVAEGGYGADNQVAPAAVGAGEALMNTALQWIYQLLGKIR